MNLDELDHLDVPAWLADLAIAVTGFCSADGDEEEPLTLERIRAHTQPQEIHGQYAYVWRRFFGELPSEQRALSSSTAPASKPAMQTPAARSAEPQQETSK